MFQLKLCVGEGRSRRALVCSTAFVLAFHLILATPTRAVEASTPEEREMALAAVEILETQPASEAAKEAIRWLTMWLVNVSDITVEVCLQTLGDSASREGLPSALLIHPAYGQAAYQIRNPDEKPGSLDVAVAGVESALRSYESRKELDPGVSSPLFEDLLERRENGELRRKLCRK